MCECGTLCSDTHGPDLISQSRVHPEDTCSVGGEHLVSGKRNKVHSQLPHIDRCVSDALTAIKRYQNFGGSQLPELGDVHFHSIDMVHVGETYDPGSIRQPFANALAIVSAGVVHAEWHKLDGYAESLEHCLDVLPR